MTAPVATHLVNPMDRILKSSGPPRRARFPLDLFELRLQRILDGAEFHQPYVTVPFRLQERFCRLLSKLNTSHQSGHESLADHPRHHRAPYEARSPGLRAAAH